uniref:Proteasome subunit alpha type-3 n=1 Tax=Tetraselmis sp. GSL018 TaxID=582737 RepID=A0A061QUJ2_9CHLO|mmetsp:Transcript_17644/g.42314  ORF Transcript_17644/g.42314 Transcript_17644/m.42314 type:complete len:249 (+) Transcript_17644:173-919(+)
MAGIGTGYDLSVTTFSPDGRVFQTEYAQKAVDNAGTAAGIRCKDGVVLAVEKLVLSKMLVPGSNRRIHAVDRHAGIATTGLAPDGRQIVNRAQSEAANYKQLNGSKIPGHVLNERLAAFNHIFSLYWTVRPFGCSSLLAVADKNGPALYLIEPSGIGNRYFGAAVGKGRQQARTEIERLKLSEMTCREGVKELAKIIYRVHEEEKPFELEMGWVCEESGMEFRHVPAEVQREAEEFAKAALEAEDMED